MTSRKVTGRNRPKMSERDGCVVDLVTASRFSRRGVWCHFQPLSAHQGKVSIHTTIWLSLNFVSPNMTLSSLSGERNLRVTHTPLPFNWQSTRCSPEHSVQNIWGRGWSPGWITSSPEALSLSRATVTLTLSLRMEAREASPQTALCRRGAPRLRPALLLLVLESWRAVRLVADRFFHSHSDRPYPAESDPKCIPFSGERRLHQRAKKTGERHGRC